MQATAVEELKPFLKEPFPPERDSWTCPKTGLIVPKGLNENIAWRARLLARAENDRGMQADMMAACAVSKLFWINAFCWTFHQFDINEEGKRVDARYRHMPFISWEIQDDMFDAMDECVAKGEDILIDKARDMGASWCCVDDMHWDWLFTKDSQLLEMSRTEAYVDQTGNMKALFQKHDYINQWLPEWMTPPLITPGSKNRTKLHMFNALNGSCIDGESTTEHAGSGDRRKKALLDEFAKVDNGRLIRSATRDVALVRIINSTPAGAGTEYSRWKNSGQIKVFVLPFHEHPEKGKGRYIAKNETGGYDIRSPWFDHEETVRTKQELAREVLRQDIESGDTYFTIPNVEKHIFLFGREPHCRMHVNFVKNLPNERIPTVIGQKLVKFVSAKRGKGGPLRVWTQLIDNRPDQSKQYIFGIDIGKGQGASESVVSIKCKETGEKIAEWRDANTPPYDMARIVVALAIWVGGRKPRGLPFLKWEMNGPGWDFSREIVKKFQYPYFYKQKEAGKVTEKTNKTYGWHSNQNRKEELLGAYDRVIAHGGYINHSIYGLEQMKQYVHYEGGGIGPAALVEESSSARKTHGDVVIADALTIEDREIPKARHTGPEAPVNSTGHRQKMAMKKKRAKKDKRHWRESFNFGN